MILEGVKETLSSADPYQLLPEGVGIEEGGLGSSIGSYNELVQQRQAYLQSGTEKNPVIETIDQQLDSLRQNLLNNIRTNREVL